MKKVLFITAITLLCFVGYGQNHSSHARNGYNSNHNKGKTHKTTRPHYESERNGSNHQYSSSANHNGARGHYGKSYTHNQTARNSYHSTRKYSNSYYKGSYKKPTYHYNHSTRKYYYYNRPVHYRPTRYTWDNRYYRASYIPSRVNIYWTRNMHAYYRSWYPDVIWRMNYGSRISTVSAFDARYYIGDVKRVYGRVIEVFYDNNSDAIYLYFSAPYPNHNFSVVIPSEKLNEFPRDIVRYFEDENVCVTGLISRFDRKPEMVIHSRSQIERY